MTSRATVLSIGPHRVRHGNVLDGLGDLMQGDRADLVYSDPPWGQGNLNYWQTMNTKMTGVEKTTLDHDQFLTGVLGEIARYAKSYVLLEYGCGWRREFIGRAEKAGLVHMDTITPSYRSGSGLLPYDLHLFARPGTPQGALPIDAQGKHGIAVIRTVLPRFVAPGGIFLDPCCGLGLMLRVAKENGMHVRGNEINAARLRKAMERLER